MKNSFATEIVKISSVFSTDGLTRIRSTPFMNRMIKKIDQRSIYIDDFKVIDFAHCGYLGLDNDLIEEDIQSARNWGMRNGWSRITGSTSLSRELETELEVKLGFPHARLAQSISLINLTVFYALGKIFRHFFLERDIHVTLRKGIIAANLNISENLHNWKNSDLIELENKLRILPFSEKKLIAVDGIYSMKGVEAPIEELLNICKRFNAVLFVDDAHGFGVQGNDGYGVIQNKVGFDPSLIIYVGSFSKCTSNSVAFICFDSSLKELIDGHAPFLIFSGPPSNVHISVALRHFKNFSNDSFKNLRKKIRIYSEKIFDHCVNSKIRIISSRGSPIISLAIDPNVMENIVESFYSQGVLGKPAIFPVVRRGDELVRFTISAAHFPVEIDKLISTINHNTLFLGQND